MVSATTNSFQALMKVKMAVTAMAGTPSGKNTFRSVSQRLPPSIHDASSRSFGMVSK